MLVVFDVDGTLIGGEAADWLAFGTAIESVLQFAADETFFAGLPEVTAQSIAEAAIRASGAALGAGLERRIHDEYFRGLRLAHNSNPLTFQPRRGVLELLQRLTSMPGVKVALATGDWQATIAFKLAAAGIDFSTFPIATSSDTPRRADIIRLAAERAGLPLSQTVYVGDGVWDMRACRELEIPFIGTGGRTHRLSESGVEHLLEPLEPAAFLFLLQALGLPCQPDRPVASHEGSPSPPNREMVPPDRASLQIAPSVIRRAAGGDASAIEGLYRELVSGPLTHVLPGQIATLSESSTSFLLVVESDGVVCATALLNICADAMYGTQPFGVIENIVVTEAMRGRGIARLLLEYIEQLAVEHHCTKLMLLSGTAREAAHAFFRRNGFASDTKHAFVKYRRQFSNQ